MVILVRADLKMSKGKIAVQVAHGAVAASEEARKNKPEWWQKWMQEGQKKVALKVSSLEELELLEKKAAEKGLPHAKIRDMGLTEIPPGTITVLAIGPAPSELVDELTGDLPLL